MFMLACALLSCAAGIAIHPRHAPTDSNKRHSPRHQHNGRIQHKPVSRRDSKQRDAVSKLESLHRHNSKRNLNQPHHGQELHCPAESDHTVYGGEAIQPNYVIKFKGLGEITAREYGRRGGKFALAIHSVHSDGSEWEPVALQLQAKGWYVLVPNWSSNKKTDPAQCVHEDGWSRWRCYPKAYTSNLNDILKITGYDKFDALLGFSWGGWAVGMRAAKFPDSVKRVVLVAPAFLEEDEVEQLFGAISAPTAIFWGNDDRWVPYENNAFVRKMVGGRLSFNQEAGDHCIHPQWEDQIVSFVEAGTEASYDPH